jgi:hypothetical protein
MPAPDINGKAHFDKLLEDSRIYDKVDRDRAEIFERMVRTPAWLLFVELVNDIIETRGAELLSPAGSIDGVLAGEHLKGSMSGLIMARDLPSVIIAHMEAMKSPAQYDASEDEDEDDS